MTENILLAAAGGAIYNILPLLELQHTPPAERPDLRDWAFWLPFAIWPILAALLGYVHARSEPNMSPMLALNVGVSAPLILRAMLRANPLQEPTEDAGGDDA